MSSGGEAVCDEPCMDRLMEEGSLSGAHWYAWHCLRASSGNMAAQAVEVLRALEALMPEGQLEVQGRLEACVVNMQGMQSQFEQQQQEACKQLDQIRVKVSQCTSC